MEILRIASVFLVLVVVHGRYHDYPLPLPPPNEAARSLQAWTVPEEDAVLAIERELEQELGLHHRPQIPVPADSQEDDGEFPKLSTPGTGELPGYKPTSANS